MANLNSHHISATKFSDCSQNEQEAMALGIRRTLEVMTGNDLVSALAKVMEEEELNTLFDITGRNGGRKEPEKAQMTVVPKIKLEKDITGTEEDIDIAEEQVSDTYLLQVDEEDEDEEEDEKDPLYIAEENRNKKIKKLRNTKRSAAASATGLPPKKKIRKSVSHNGSKSNGNNRSQGIHIYKPEHLEALSKEVLVCPVASCPRKGLPFESFKRASEHLRMVCDVQWSYKCPDERCLQRMAKRSAVIVHAKSVHRASVHEKNPELVKSGQVDCRTCPDCLNKAGRAKDE